MDFDSPDAAKEFPGLYLADAGKANDSLEYPEDGDKKKSKKEKKDSKKDKGYSALAAESDEEVVPEHPKSPGKVKKIKAFSKLSGKKKDKDKKGEKLDKEQKKTEKEAKEKRKSEDKDRKSLEKELTTPTPGPSAPRSQIPFSGAHLKSNNASFDASTPVKRSIISAVSLGTDTKETTPAKPHKEKSAGFNVFLNAPAPILSKLKDRDHAKKEHKDKDKHKNKDGKSKESGMAKVKLKLMRSKNSLEDSSSDLPTATSTQLQDTDAILKEIKKYEGLLEHAHLKASKKTGKKQEEQLWELQRTLTQLKRKLRSINALSSATSYHVHAHALATERANSLSVSPPPGPHPIFKKCESIDHSTIKTTEPTVPAIESKPVVVERVIKDTEAKATVLEIPKLPMPPSGKNTQTKSETGVTTTSPISIKTPSTSPHIEPVISPQNLENSLPSSKTLSPVSTINTQSEPKEFPTTYNLASPRPSIDTVAQVHHRLSVATDKSDAEEANDDLDAEEFPLNDKDESTDFTRPMLKERSISNYSQDSKEDIEAVLDDANKMIGSMHEELIFDDIDNDMSQEEDKLRSSEQLRDPSNQLLKTEDAELFNSDFELNEEDNLPTEDPFTMAIFDNIEYLHFEHEALTAFNEQLKEDLFREEAEFQEIFLKQSSQLDSGNDNQNEDDDVDLGLIWTQLKSDNEALWDNVNRLRVAVASCKVDELRLQTRLNYIESKVTAYSPAETTTPLQQAEG